MPFTVILSFLLFVVSSLPGFAAALPSPEEFLGHPVGADFQLARWDRITSYFQLAGKESDRVIVEDIGPTTEGNSYLLATISSADTIREIDRYKSIQRKLSHPNEMSEGERDTILQQAKTVILISCSIHSNEIGASQMAMELLYQLATGDDERTREILANDIILLVPSANPDGIDKVIDWYESSLGKPWEGQGMPWLYQKYTGHDDNRDWFMVTQKETQILTRVLYHEWYPCIIYDLHQMGSEGSRFFVPPFFDPINPNVDPVIHESLKLIGGHMATELAENGKKGVITNAMYDNWWHGGNRTTPYRHNMVGLLTEAASPRIASPIFQRKSELKGHTRGLPSYAPQVNFADPWDGGWWRLRDVVDYERIACYALFTVGARYRDRFNRNYLELNEKAIRLGQEIPPFAFLVPRNQRDLPTAERLLQILLVGGVDIAVAEDTFLADGVQYDKGDYIIYAAQPYRNHVKDLLDPQEYPDRFLYPGGPAESPYDVAGWTLSYQMGVNVIPVQRPFSTQTRPADLNRFTEGGVTGNGPIFISKNYTTNDFILLNRLFDSQIAVSIAMKNIVMGNHHETISPGSLLIAPADSTQQNELIRWGRELGLQLSRTTLSLPNDEVMEVPKPRVGLFQPWAASMDEGWTRFVLEQFEFDYETIHNAGIRAGNLNQRYDVIILPDVGTSTIMDGMSESTTAPEYIGGIGNAGVAHLQEFVEQGGRLLCLDSSSLFAIRYFSLPVKNALAGIGKDTFFCPGSILRIHLNSDSPIAYGMSRRAAAYFAHSYAFDIITGTTEQNPAGPIVGKPEIVATYDDTTTLLSGWILGESKLQNKSAVVSIPYGQGKVILYGFRVQHRAQPHGTFRLLFNGIILAQ
ncbi:MAG: peptidase M14 [Candidatus Omnitrophota bacterium]|jgi:hypothetical protein|nr:MAG: peptidase M14 [Candidatus Omnitrophota bacterium]